MRDRTIAGLLSGVAAGVALNAASTFSHYVLHIGKFCNLDMMSVALMGQPAKTPLHVVAALLYDLVFAGGLGAAFALILGIIGQRHLWAKGWLFGTLVSVLALFTTTFFRMPHLLILPPATVLAHLVDTSLWGLTQAFVLRRLLRGSL